MRPPRITKPTIHLNGTSPESLCEQYLDARTALRTAIEKLRASAPHERDYYPQEDNSFRAARGEHDLRFLAVAGALEEIEALLNHSRKELRRRRKDTSSPSD